MQSNPNVAVDVATARGAQIGGARAGYFRLLTADESIDLVADKLEVVLGRDPSADVVLPGTKVSRRHAKITWDQSCRSFQLQLLGKNGGLYVNGDQIERTTYLKSQDCIQFKASSTQPIPPIFFLLVAQ
mmetsp:Transcript_55011/g.130000  ORF Transcript_55011/g.130000 Transcript_55011/m.130000 type:complete len:129 (+) Transcript_55011:78-464(+)